MPTPPLPLVPKKYVYENAQFDFDSPSILDGVMQRWIVPEGEEEREPAVRVVAPLPISIEGGLFPDVQEKEGEGTQEENSTLPPSNFSYQVSLRSFFFGFILLMLFNLAFFIILLLTRK